MGRHRGPFLKNHSVEGDAHAGRFIQQISGEDDAVAAQRPANPSDGLRAACRFGRERFQHSTSTTRLKRSHRTIGPYALPLWYTPTDREFSDRQTRRAQNTVCADRPLQKGLKRVMIRKNGRPRFRCGVQGMVSASGRVKPGVSLLLISPGLAGRFSNNRNFRGKLSSPLLTVRPALANAR